MKSSKVIAAFLVLQAMALLFARDALALRHSNYEVVLFRDGSISPDQQAIYDYLVDDLGFSSTNVSFVDIGSIKNTGH